MMFFKGKPSRHKSMLFNKKGMLQLQIAYEKKIKWRNQGVHKRNYIEEIQLERRKMYLLFIFTVS